MSTRAVQSPVATVDPLTSLLYEPGVYQAADAKSEHKFDGTDSRSQYISRLSTNVIMEILRNEVISPLADISDLVKQLEIGGLDASTTARVEAIFRAIGFTPSRNKGPRLEGDRKDLALRTANLFRSKYSNGQMGVLAAYLSRTRNFSKDEVFQSILGCLSEGSLSDAIGNRARAFIAEDCRRQEQKLAQVKGVLSAEKEKLSAEKEKLSAEKEKLSAEKEKLSAEKEKLSAEKEKLEGLNLKIFVVNRLGQTIASNYGLAWRKLVQP